VNSLHNILKRCGSVRIQFSRRTLWQLEVGLLALVIFLFLYFYCKHWYIFLLGRFSTIFLPRRRGTPPEPRTLQQEQLKQQLQQFPTSASLGSRIPAKQKEGGEHHGKIHPDPLHPLPRIYRNPTRFPYLTSTPSWPWCYCTCTCIKMQFPASLNDSTG
jgi:hypothetical protein